MIDVHEPFKVNGHALNELRRQGDFRHQKQHGLSTFQCIGYEMNVNFRFSRSRDAMQQCHPLVLAAQRQCLKRSVLQVTQFRQGLLLTAF